MDIKSIESDIANIHSLRKEIERLDGCLTEIANDFILTVKIHNWEFAIEGDLRERFVKILEGNREILLSNIRELEWNIQNLVNKVIPPPSPNFYPNEKVQAP